MGLGFCTSWMLFDGLKADLHGIGFWCGWRLFDGLKADLHGIGFLYQLEAF